MSASGPSGPLVLNYRFRGFRSSKLYESYVLCRTTYGLFNTHYILCELVTLFEKILAKKWCNFIIILIILN